MKHFFSLSETSASNMELFEINYVLWLVIPIAIMVITFFIFKKYKNFGKTALFVIAVYMIVVRLVKNIVFKAWLWDEGWENVLPFQLCGVLIYVLPFTVFFNTKKLNAYIYPLAILGGFIMMLYPDWVFNGNGLNFNKIESLIAHSLLVSIPLWQVALGKFEFNIKEVWKPIVALAALAFYAHIGNLLIPNRNFMFLVVNPLPIALPLPHVIVFGAVCILLVVLMYIPSTIKKILKSKH